MPYSMKRSFLIVPETKTMDTPLFLSKKKMKYTTTYFWTILENIGIRNPLEISISPYL